MRDKFQVFEPIVGPVTVLVMDMVARGDWTVGCHPNLAMQAEVGLVVAAPPDVPGTASPFDASVTHNCIPGLSDPIGTKLPQEV